MGAWRGDDAVLPLEAAEWEGFAGLHDEDGLWAGGSGSGSVVYRAQLPAEAAQAGQITLLAELSAWRPGYKQTDGETTSTDVTVIANGQEIDCITLPDSPCDSRGALSGIAGKPCKYGYRVEVPIKGGQLRSVFSRAPEVEVRFQVKADAQNVGGLCVYESTAGRYPFGPCLIMGEVKVETPPIPPRPKGR